MATPPTRVTSSATAFNNATSPKTADVSVESGDVITVRFDSETYDSGLPTWNAVPAVSGGGLTWTEQQRVQINNYNSSLLWTATATSATTITVSITYSASNGGYDLWWGFRASVWRGSNGVGNSAKANGTGLGQLSLTTSSDNSAIDLTVGDWNSIDGASRTWLTVNGSAITEETYYRDASGSRYTHYTGYSPDAGSAGSKTVGLSAPTGLKYSIIAVEITGVSSTFVPRSTFLGVG